MIEKVEQVVTGFHKGNPLKRGISREELRSKLKTPPKIFNALVEEWIDQGKLIADLTNLALPGFSIHLTIDQKQRIEKLVKKFGETPSNPPSTKESILEVGENLYKMLIDNGELVQLSEDVVYTSYQFEKEKTEIIDYLMKNESITVAIFRDMYQTSRKYALAFLEYLDQKKITRRDGDFRKLIKH